ncbi:ATP-grasp domain-containing protein [Paenibacillus eucommiae]|uniref:Carbamoyl-phosphate synthase large subunit n=1 Tax=Paenibacillus eucommiae TaxID=1355755 RepID=A0ABS4J6T5_9BACL|nr:ATP-grasp domain-containing protein [Paenibacillus eucommiae]MBP1995572.1 carbamoyl-phosphate synthase large subunit [Paenibacillus eucommiae]
MTAFNILFTSVGRRVSLVRYFKEVLKELSLDGKIVTADMKNNAPAACVGDIHELLPHATDPFYISRLLEICSQHDIKLLIPLIDTELQVLAEHRLEFEGVGTCVLVSSPEVTRICYDKRKTSAFFKSIQVNTPQTLNGEQILSNPHTCYPLMLKPANGSGSVGATKINNAEELAFFLKYIPNSIVQDYIVGQEYTIDVLMDFQGKAHAAVPRLRLETRAGEVCKGMTVKDSTLMTTAKKVAEALPGAIGCITLQCFVTSAGKIVFIEINPRFGGGVPLSFVAGANYPKAIIQWLLERPISWMDMDDWQDGLVMLRYDDAFFVDVNRQL